MTDSVAARESSEWLGGICGQSAELQKVWYAILALKSRVFAHIETLSVIPFHFRHLRPPSLSQLRRRVGHFDHAPWRRLRT
jgi:hypothetical protein